MSTDRIPSQELTRTEVLKGHRILHFISILLVVVTSTLHNSSFIGSVDSEIGMLDEYVMYASVHVESVPLDVALAGSCSRAVISEMQCN